MRLSTGTPSTCVAGPTSVGVVLFVQLAFAKQRQYCAMGRAVRCCLDKLDGIDNPQLGRQAGGGKGCMGQPAKVLLHMQPAKVLLHMIASYSSVA